MRIARQIAVIGIALAAAVVGAPAQEAYPPEVRAYLEDHRKFCVKEGGTGVDYPPGAVKKIDLTGDGRSDYIVDFRDATCSGWESLFCGTGGCVFAIFVAKQNGKLVKVFDQPVRSYEIKPGRGASTITFSLHGGYCGNAGAYSCPKSRRISLKPFEYKQK